MYMYVSIKSDGTVTCVVSSGYCSLAAACEVSVWQLLPCSNPQKEKKQQNTCIPAIDKVIRGNSEHWVILNTYSITDCQNKTTERFATVIYFQVGVCVSSTMNKYFTQLPDAYTDEEKN